MKFEVTALNFCKALTTQTDKSDGSGDPSLACVERLESDIFYFPTDDTPGQVYGKAKAIGGQKMAGQRIRINLKAYDHELIDASALKIVETAKRSGGKVSGPIPLPTDREVVTILRSPTSTKTAANNSRCAPTSV